MTIHPQARASGAFPPPSNSVHSRDLEPENGSFPAAPQLAFAQLAQHQQGWDRLATGCLCSTGRSALPSIAPTSAYPVVKTGVSLLGKARTVQPARPPLGPGARRAGEARSVFPAPHLSNPAVASGLPILPADLSPCPSGGVRSAPRASAACSHRVAHGSQGAAPRSALSLSRGACACLHGPPPRATPPPSPSPCISG